MKIKLLFLLLMLSSCSVSFKSTKSKGGIKDLSSFIKINGRYENNRGDPHKLKTLENILFVDFAPKLKGDENSTITLEVINEKRIKARLYSDGKLLKTKLLKGKIKDDYFWVKRRTKFYPRYILINFFVSSKFRIGILANGNLTVDVDSKGCGLLVFFPYLCSGYSEHKAIFKRVK